MLRLLVFVSLLMLSGCATVFTSYPQQADRWKQALVADQGAKQLPALEAKAAGSDGLLYALEAGRVAQLSNDTDTSKKWFEDAAGRFDQEDEAARIRVSGLAQTTGAMLSNDKAIHYHSDPFERIFSYTFQALNYLQQGDMTGAGVEFRRVDHEQREQELEHQSQIAKAEEKNGGKPADTGKYDGYFEGLNTAAAGVRSAVQNAWSYYLTAAFWEGTGNYNDALVDYKQALQIFPEADFIKEDVQRISGKMNGKRNANGLLVVTLEQGFVPAKTEVSIPIPTTQGLVSVSFPTYSGTGVTNALLMRISAAGQETATQPLVRVGALAAKALKEELPGLITRQVARTTAKYAMQKEANRQSAVLGLVTQLYNLVSEQSDLRSWLTLPAYGQVARMELPSGEQQVQLSLSGGDANVTVPIRAQGVTLLRVVDLNGRLITQVMPVASSN